MKDISKEQILVIYTCPKTNKPFVSTVDAIEIDGFCANDYYPSEHYLNLYCDACNDYHKLF